MTTAWREQLEAAVAVGDGEALTRMAQGRVARVLRYLNSRLYSSDEAEKQRALRALGILVRDVQLVSHQRAADLLRRYVWALNDESGAVPYGMPEAIGEVLAVRPEFREAFLPILCSLLTEEEMSQTGPIERGALRAVGRLGAAAHSAKVVATVRLAADAHPDPETREVAAATLAAITGTGRQ